jgi:putative hydrolase of the HAD superfamily
VKIRVVTVDFWGTLLFDGPGSDERYRRARLADFGRILASVGISPAPPALERAYESSGEYLARIWRESRDVPVTEHVRAVLSALDPRLPERLPAAVMEALVDAYARPALVVPPAVDPGARHALEKLRDQGRTLALVSNTMRTPGRTLRRLLEHYGLLSCFAETVFSDEVGVRKPAPEIFSRALRAVGGDPETAVHVGDDPVLDVQGARAAGMRVIQVAAGAAPDGPTPDAVIPDLAALPDAIADLESR